MSSKSGRKNTSVIEDLQGDPQRYSFVQLVRLLELSSARQNQNEKSDDTNKISAKPIARFSPPQRECIRFLSQQTLTFPENEITRVTRSKGNTEFNQWQVYTAFLGLNGAQGVLPFHYTRLVLERIKHKDPTLEHFFNLFNHRSISLFFQASVKYHLPIEFERKRSNPESISSRDCISQILHSIVGLGTRGLEQRLSVPDEAILFYGGLFSQQVRSASGLQQILSSYFNVSVRIEEFLGRWQELIDDVRSRMPDRQNPKGQNVCLGRNAMLGKRGWFAQGKVRVVLGPLSGEQFRDFAPGSTALKSINEILRFYIGIENDYDFKILVDRATVPDKVVLNKKNPPIMGWNTWLAKPKDGVDTGQSLMKVSISPMTINSL